ncbi:MAG: nucleotide exchange factor GrpE [Candidatus Omnitrophica bacterium]|nr:nucleotide exchange factor GrpE [Candidatus Omnitrophota bacterium]MCM8807707.1 nucleotide exchange factor GrpE [Candidatus Omnitrophota bacterium]
MKNERIYFIKERDLINLREAIRKVKELEKEKREIEEKNEELKDKYLRLLAEFDNFRKRVEKEKKEILKYGNETIILQLIPFDEIFESVLKQLEKTKNLEEIKRGIELLKKEFTKLLESLGVKRIKAKGEKFNPDFHEAIGIVETDEHPDGMIIEEEKSGYIYNDRVIRPSLVKVAKKKTEDNAGNKSACES